MTESEMPAARAQALLAHVREATGDADATFADPPSRLTGGYDTELFRFRLNGAPLGLSGELVLRAFPSSGEAGRAGREASVQNALADSGLPVPRVHLVSAEAESRVGEFVVMDFVPGGPLLDIEEPRSSLLMGETHAMLHEREVVGVVEALAGDGFRNIFLDDVLERVGKFGRRFPWALDVVDWLAARRPKEASWSICHGDFHKMNILQVGGRVSSILDWSGFAVMEAAYDVANTQLLFSIVAKSLIAQGDFDPTDLDRVVRDYRAGYEAKRRLDETNLDYYLVMRAAMILFLGASGANDAYRNPGLVAELCALIRQISRVSISADAVVGG